MLENGFIHLHRSLLKWEWYNDVNTTRLFVHLLLTVNYEPQKWQGFMVERGQRVASYGVLATETNLSIRNIRTALKYLISTGEVTHTSTSRYGVFTVNNYDMYQQPTHETTVSRQSSDSQPTVSRQQWNKDNKSNKEKDKKTMSAPPTENDFFESVWKLLPSHKNDVKKNVKPARKKQLMALGYNAVKVACEEYLYSQNQNYLHKRDRFFNDIIDNYISPEPQTSVQTPEISAGGRIIQ